MATSAYKTLPTLKGILTALGPWTGLFGRADMRIYPFSLGAMVAADSAGVTVSLRGRGEFANNDYAIVCRKVNYGGAPFWVPDLSRIVRVTAVSSTADQVTVGAAVTVVQGEYLFNLETDTAASPLTAPNYDGSGVTLYDDQTGDGGANSDKFLVTSQGGTYRGWVNTGQLIVDVLVTDGSGRPVLALPLTEVGPEILA